MEKVGKKSEKSQEKVVKKFTKSLLNIDYLGLED